MDKISRMVAKMHRDSAERGYRSFDNVDRKFAEADFFLEKLNDTRNNLVEAGFYFSAFLSATRSVTFALQSVMSDVDGFKDWYTERQNELRSNPVARYFKDQRDMALHPGESAIFSTSSTSSGDSKGSEYLLWPAMDGNSDPNQELIEAGPAARQYMMSLAALIVDCYETFGPIIDPEQYYTKMNFERLGLSVEDVEESLGYPRGWTFVDGSEGEIEERLQLIC